jgi:hypothetical protein
MIPTQIVINDGKQKAKSYEAEIEFHSDGTYWGFFNAKFVGYGVDEWSAKMNLIEQTETLIKKLQELKASVY